MPSQYRHHHPDDFREWLFREFVTALTPKERQGLVKWQLERIVCRECRDPPCSEWCQRRCEAKRFLEIIEEEERRHKCG